MKRKIITISLIFIFCFSFLVDNPQRIDIVSASPIMPPQGWTFAKENQKIPVSLDDKIYYAYELEKVSSNTPGGWLITDSEDRIIYDSDTYQKLALAATVKKFLDDISTKTIMQNEMSLLKSIKWRIDLYETNSTISKLVIDMSTALTGNLFGYGGIEELFSTALVPVKSREGNNVQDKLFDVFSKQFVADAVPQISKCLEIIGKVSTSNNAKILKLFSILNIVLRKEAASFVRGGYEAYESAYEIAQKSRSYWSYTEASDFLNEFKEGRTRGLPFAKWYLTLIPHSSNQLENIGSVVWENVIKETIGGLYSPNLEDMKNFTLDWVDAMDLSGKFIKETLSNELITSQLSDDIKSASAIFSIYSLYYDASTSGTLANQILSALREEKDKEETSVKDKTIYKNGDRVQATDYINVREEASKNGKVITLIKKGEIGTIVSNYIIADGYRWWTVKWDSGSQGWCAGEYLKAYKVTATKDYYFPSVNIVININKDSSFNLVEKRTYKFTGEYSWGTYVLSKSGYDRIENFSIADEAGTFTRTNSETKTPSTFVFTDNGSSYTAKFFYHAADTERTFTFSYKVIGGIKVYQDVTDFYWTLIGSGWDKETKLLEAYIYLPEDVNEKDLYVFGHGPANGTVEKIDGRGARYKLNNLPANTFVEARIVFPSNILTTTKIPENKLDQILLDEETGQKQKVIVLAESLMITAEDPAGLSFLGGCKGDNCWKVLSFAHYGDILDCIATDTKTFTPKLWLSFPGCSTAFKVKDKKGNIGWIAADWSTFSDSVVLAQVIDSKNTQNYNKVSFPNLSGKWTGTWLGILGGKSKISYNFVQDDTITFSGTGTVVMDNNSEVIDIHGTIINNTVCFLELYPDGHYLYCSGKISQDGKTISGDKNSYDSLAIFVGPFEVTFNGN